jgi:hypothetical protein
MAVCTGVSAGRNFAQSALQMEAKSTGVGEPCSVKNVIHPPLAFHLFHHHGFTPPYRALPSTYVSRTGTSRAPSSNQLDVTPNAVNPSVLDEKMSPSIQGGMSCGNAFLQRVCSMCAAASRPFSRGVIQSARRCNCAGVGQPGDSLSGQHGQEPMENAFSMSTWVAPCIQNTADTASIWSSRITMHVACWLRPIT